jgi:hypothetical protein
MRLLTLTHTHMHHTPDRQGVDARGGGGGGGGVGWSASGVAAGTAKAFGLAATWLASSLDAASRDLMGDGWRPVLASLSREGVLSVYETDRVGTQPHAAAALGSLSLSL